MFARRIWQPRPLEPPRIETPGLARIEPQEPSVNLTLNEVRAAKKCRDEWASCCD